MLKVICSTKSKNLKQMQRKPFSAPCVVTLSSIPFHFFWFPWPLKKSSMSLLLVYLKFKHTPHDMKSTLIRRFCIAFKQWFIVVHNLPNVMCHCLWRANTWKFCDLTKMICFLSLVWGHLFLSLLFFASFLMLMVPFQCHLWSFRT